MKNKKVIALILVVLVVIIMAKIFVIINRQIPSNYSISITTDTSAVDGPCTTLYIYNNKIIKEIKVTSPMKSSTSIKEVKITQSIKTNIDQLIQYLENTSNMTNGSQSVWNYYVVKVNGNSVEKTFYVKKRTVFDKEKPDVIQQKIDTIFSEI